VKRKTKCDKHLQNNTDTLQNNTDNLQNNTDNLQNNTDNLQNNTDSLQNNTDSLQNNSDPETLFDKINGTDIVRCTKCKKVMKQSNIIRHISVCKGVPTNTCQYCNKEFKHQPNLSAHQKICKGKEKALIVPTNNEEQQQITNNNINTQTNNNGNNMVGDYNVQNNNTQNITINALGDPKMYLDWYYKRESENPEEFQKFLSNVVKNGQNGMCELMRDVHLNTKYLENKNIRKTNKKDPTCEYYDGQEWQLGVFENCIMKSLEEFKGMGFFDKIVEDNKNCCTKFFSEVARPLDLLSKDTVDEIYEKIKFEANKIDLLRKYANDMINILGILFYFENKKNQVSSSVMSNE
jgi:hypothetical protein